MATAQNEVVTQLPPSSASVVLADDTHKNVTGADNVLALARDFEVDSPEMYDAAVEELKDTKRRWSALEEKRKELTKPLLALKKQWDDFFKPALDALKSAENHYKGLLQRYDDEQERIRRKREAEEKERARIEQERLAAEAKKAEEAGNKEVADELIEQASQVQAFIPAPAPQPTATGVSTRETWSAEVKDLMRLVQAVADGAAPIESIQPDMKFLNAQAKAFKNSLPRSFPGVEAKCEKSKAIRA